MVFNRRCPTFVPVLLTVVRRGREPIGFTLVELLVVIAIVGTMVGLAVPAAQAVRESSRGNACRNNLRQTGLASLGFVGVRGRFPPGHQGRVLGSTAQEEWNESVNNFAGHLGFLLPWLEESSLHAELTAADPRLFSDAGTSGAWFLKEEVFRVLASRSVPAFLCPSDSPVSIGPTIAAIDVYVQRSNVPVALVTDYLGCSGAPPLPRDTDGGDGVRGIFHSRSRVRPSDVVDGLSKTILLGEVLGDSPEFHSEVIEARHSSLCGGVATFSFGVPPDLTMSGIDEAVMYRSRHPGKVNMGFADASVRPMAAETDIAVIQALATRAGGEAVDPSAF